jgi:uncharacterized oligopeptide transporter (OPT) family protein
MALTSWTPVGALSKITQFSMGAFDHTNAATNLSAAGMTGEIAGNAANLLSDIKPGYMLGAKPRQQAIGHIIGIIAGACASTPIFYLLFLPPAADGTRSVTTLVSDQFPMPGAVQWQGVAKFIQNGLDSLPASVLWAMGIAAVLALVFEVLRLATGGRWWLTGVTLGLGAVLPADACLCMFGGALFFECAKKLCRKKVAANTGAASAATAATNRDNAANDAANDADAAAIGADASADDGAGVAVGADTAAVAADVAAADATPSLAHRIWVEGLEPICAGLITGAALMGIGDALCKVLLK